VKDEQEHVLTVHKDGYHPAELRVNGQEIHQAGGGYLAVALAPASFEATSIRADDVGQLDRAARELSAKGNPSDAIEFYRRVLKLKPSHALAHRGIGICYAKMGKREESLNAYRQYLLYAPDAPDAKKVQEVLDKASGGIVIPPPKEESGF
jgi:tetratricopeptide (TPR) repeat protein